MISVQANRLPLDGKGGLIEVLRGLIDPRQPRGKRYGMTLIMAISVCAVLAGARSLSAIGQWAQNQSKATLRRMGSWTGKAPSEPTIRRVLQKIDVKALDDRVGRWLQQQNDLSGQGLALDGKTSRGSADKDSKAIHLVSAVLHQEATVLAQVRVESKTNEIKSVEPLLEGRNIAAAIVTGDAMFTQTKIAKYLVEKKHADYVLVVKGNQPTLKRDIESLNLEAFPP